MTAHERYQYLVGEIGISRTEYLYELLYWEILLIARGYARRHRQMWSSVRWQTFSLMSTQADLKKAGIFSPADLLPLPWDGKGDDGQSQNLPTKEQIEDLQRQMREYNEQHGSG